MFDFINDAVQGVTNFVGGANASTPDHTQAPAAPGSDAVAAQPDTMMGRLGQGVGDFMHGIQQEGLGGVLDYSGMMDRQQAQRDLANRFDVVPDDFQGPRRPNQVSEADYEHIAHTYSDVRMGRGDLTIDNSSFQGPNAAAEGTQYKQQMLNSVADMMQTGSGRQQIDNLSNNVARDDAGAARTNPDGTDVHHHTSIMPLWQQQQQTDASGNPVVDAANNPVMVDKAHVAANEDNTNGYASPAAGSVREGFEQRNPDGTRGVGGDVNIHINPAGVAGVRSDVIMAHEMQHTLAETQGTMARGVYDTASGGQGPDANYVDPTTGQQGIMNWERQAVGLSRTDSPTNGGAAGHYPGDNDGCTENTYREERNQLGEKWLPRDNYTTLPAQAATQAQADAAWTAHRTAQDADAQRLTTTPIGDFPTPNPDQQTA